MNDFKKEIIYSNVDVAYDHDTGVLHIWGKENGEKVPLGLFYVLEED